MRGHTLVDRGMNRVLPSLRAVLSVLVLGGCPEEKLAESGDTGVQCPRTLEQFCQREFGGACPTYAEVAAMECDGYHFAVAGSGVGPPFADNTGSPSCSDWTAACPLDEDDSTGETMIYFLSVEPGVIRNVLLRWPECGEGTAILGEPSC